MAVVAEEVGGQAHILLLLRCFGLSSYKHASIDAEHHLLGPVPTKCKLNANISKSVPCRLPNEPTKCVPLDTTAHQEELAEETGVDGQHFNVLTLGKNLQGAGLD